MKRLKLRALVQRPELLFPVIVLGICYSLGFLADRIPGQAGVIVYEILQKGFTALPVLAVLITRKITRDTKPWNFSFKVWKQPGLWLLCAVGPGVLTALGAVLYFCVFPQEYSGSFHYGALLGMTGEMPISSPLPFVLTTILLAAVFLPLQILELGEELGWRGYLLPKQIQRFGLQKGVLINSLLWGFGHLPLIYFGFNYSLDNPLAPWSNLAMMMLVCLVFGILCGAATIVSGNCMFAAIIHGVFNLIGEVPVFLSVSQRNTLLGPNPTGLVGMLWLLVSALFVFVCLKSVKNRLK